MGGMAVVVEEDESFNPIDVGAFGADGVVADADFAGESIE